MNRELQEKINREVARAFENFRPEGDEAAWIELERHLENQATENNITNTWKKRILEADKRKVGQVAAIIGGALLLIIIVVKFSGSDEGEIIEGNAGLEAIDTNVMTIETPIIPPSDTINNNTNDVVTIEETDLGEKEMNISEEEIRKEILNDYSQKKEKQTEPPKKDNKKGKKDKKDEESGFDFMKAAEQKPEEKVIKTDEGLDAQPEKNESSPADTTL